MDSQGIIDLILGPGGSLVIFIIIIFTGLRRKWVFGWQYEACLEEKAEWKEAALRGTRVAERVVTISEGEVRHVSETETRRR